MTLLLCALLACCGISVAQAQTETTTLEFVIDDICDSITFPVQSETCPTTPGLWEYRCEVDTSCVPMPQYLIRFPDGTAVDYELHRHNIDTTCVWERHECLEPVDSVLTVTPGHWEFEWSDPVETITVPDIGVKR